MFYVYLYLRDDGTPYYVGKGKGNRVNRPKLRANGKLIPAPRNKSLITIIPQTSEQEALELEKTLIKQWGREDIGTGCLLNLTDGGDQPPSRKGKKMPATYLNAEERQRRSEAAKKRWANPEFRKRCSIAVASSMRKKWLDKTYRSQMVNAQHNAWLNGSYNERRPKAA